MPAYRFDYHPYSLEISDDLSAVTIREEGAPRVVLSVPDEGCDKDVDAIVEMLPRLVTAALEADGWEGHQQNREACAQIAQGLEDHFDYP